MAKTKKPTMADVAARAGVSLSTVSLTYSGAGPISPDTKARVERAAEELGYGGPSPQGRALRSGKSGIVGVVIHEKFARSFRDPLNLRILDGLIADFGDMGVGVLLIPQPTGEPGERTLLDTAAMDAVVVLRVRDHDEPALAIAQRRGIPLVVMEGPAPEGAGSLDIDDTEATVRLISHLRELGHERIGTVTLPFGVEADTRVITREETARAAWTPIHHRLDAFELAGIEPCVIVEAHASMVEAGIAAGPPRARARVPAHGHRVSVGPARRRRHPRGSREGPLRSGGPLGDRLRRPRSAVGRAARGDHHEAGRRREGPRARRRGEGAARRDTTPERVDHAARVPSRQHHGPRAASCSPTLRASRRPLGTACG